jgi:hypothetical protein
MENVCTSPPAPRMADATTELSMPPDSRQPIGTSETICRRTACATSSRVRAAASFTRGRASS